LKKDPKERSTCDKLLQHSWITKNKETDLSKLVAIHKKQLQNEMQDVIQMTSNWPELLENNTKIPEENNFRLSTNDMGTQIIKKENIVNKKTILDPKTLRPTTVRADNSQRERVEEERIENRKVVKDQLKQIRKLQQNQQKVIAQLRNKKQQERENLQKKLSSKTKRKRKTKTTNFG